MAYQAKQRDPLLDSSMQAAIERRSKELIGIGLLGAGLAVAAILGSYSPDDPSWMSATDQPAQNLLGKFGALVASPLFIILGLASWGLVVLLSVWGVRFTLHRGAERAFARLIFAPIAIAAASVYASTLGPGVNWPHGYGLGGQFGDTFLGALLNIVPISAASGVLWLAFPIGLVTLALATFVLGFTKWELVRGARLLLLLFVMLYDGVANALAHGVRRVSKARKARSQQADTLAGQTQNTDAPTTVRDMHGTPVFGTAPEASTQPARDKPAGLIAAVSSFVKRPPPQELVEPEAVNTGTKAPTEDRIKARIADAIKSRARHGHATSMPRTEPPVMRGDAPPARRPEPLLVRNSGAIPPAPMAAIDEDEDDLLEAPQSFVVQDRADSAEALATHAPAPLARAVVQSPVRRPAQPSQRARQEAQPALAFDDPIGGYELPPLSLLASPDTVERHHLSTEALEENARMLENVLDDYGVKGEIVSVRPGPVVTMYELEPAPGLKASRVIGLADDIARSMSALSARVSTLPGRSVIGIELPNVNREKVVLREILSARDFGDTSMSLPLALGKDIGGGAMVANLAKMPHLLIAGTTGSGKSVAINTMILSLLYRLTPAECRMIMIDPKMLELSVYDGIPHLLSPVVTDPKRAVVALKWVVGEMEDRYRKMSKMGVRNIEGYNGRVSEALSKGEMFSRTVQTGFDDDTGEPVFETEEFAPKTIPFIVVIVDEMADLMMVAGKEIEACIQRLAQMARASGIHLIMATQRPSVDVITGTIKANFPTRISFQVTSKIDSRTILGEMGAEQLLGMGDMLYMAGGGKITRCHGPFVSDEEVEEVVNHLKSFGDPEYINGVVDGPDEDKESSIDQVLGLGGNTDGEDALYDQAVAIVVRDRKCSTSYIQRKLSIGYNKAARLVEQMEDQGVVSSSNHVGKREVLVPEQN
ncbi:MAG: S-DNA-T family DNA segregation ATPase FtsK/SpoIIIE [Paracoccaceae bacterium]|jgi:S-DNA-T family DNA segregation ATPase FtsK/SpoIIIE